MSSLAKEVHEIQERKALKKQVGGSHYAEMKMQPAEYCLVNMTVEELKGVLKWMNMKYMWRDKGGKFREDWQKAKHYIHMIEEEIERRMNSL